MKNKHLQNVLKQQQQYTETIMYRKLPHFIAHTAVFVLTSFIVVETLDKHSFIYFFTA